MESAPGTATGLSPAQRKTLVALKRRGEASVDALATALAITPSAARQQLSALRVAGLVASRQQRGRPGLPGRPADLYHTTPQGEALFAEQCGHLSVEVLGLIEEEDPALVARVFERRRQRRVEQVREQLAGKDFEEKMGEVAASFDAEGYMADLDKLAGERYRITLCNCAIWPVASRYEAACTTELQFLRAVLPEAEVERVEHKVAGAYVCGYEFGSRNAERRIPAGQARGDRTPASTGGAR